MLGTKMLLNTGVIRMSKFVVAVFPTEAKAYEGTHAVKDL